MIIDEFGAHKDYSLYEVCRSSQTYKPNAQIVAITTAYPNTSTSPAYEERCILIDAYEGKTEQDERYFSVIYELDKDDDYADINLWGKSNPLFVEFPSIMEKLESDFNNAMKSPEKRNLFLTKNLNVWIQNDSTTSYIDFDNWRECQEDKVDFTGREVIVGIDMSKAVDLTAVSIIARDGDGFILKSKAFIPSEVVNMKESTDKIPYGAYAETDKDWVGITDGKFVDQKVIEEYVRSIEETYSCRIKAVAFDSWGSLGLMSSLSYDYEVIDVKMTYKNFSPAIKKFRENVYNGSLKHEYNPVLNFCVSNAVTKSDLQENILLDKKKSVNRIDLLVASIIAYSEFFNEDLEEESGYFIV